MNAPARRLAAVFLEHLGAREQAWADAGDDLEGLLERAVASAHAAGSEGRGSEECRAGRRGPPAPGLHPGRRLLALEDRRGLQARHARSRPLCPERGDLRLLGPDALRYGHVFGYPELNRLARIDPAVKPTFEAVAATREEYVKCNLAILDKQEKEISAVLKASGPMTSAQQDAKIKPIGDRYRKQQEQSCDKGLAKLEKTIAAFVEERNTARRKLWEGTASLRASLAGKP